jgi:hypothetical protein
LTFFVFPDTLGFKNFNRPKRLFAKRNMILSGVWISTTDCLRRSLGEIKPNEISSTTLWIISSVTMRYLVVCASIMGSNFMPSP